MTSVWFVKRTDTGEWMYQDNSTLGWFWGELESAMQPPSVKSFVWEIVDRTKIPAVAVEFVEAKACRIQALKDAANMVCGHCARGFELRENYTWDGDHFFYYHADCPQCPASAIHRTIAEMEKS